MKKVYVVMCWGGTVEDSWVRDVFDDFEAALDSVDHLVGACPVDWRRDSDGDFITAYPDDAGRRYGIEAFEVTEKEKSW